VILLTRDHALIDHVTALADAATARVLVRGNLPPAGPGDRLTLIGPDVATDLPRGRHGGVLVVRVDGADPPDGIWRLAVEIGAERVALLPEAEPWLLEQLMEAAAPARRGLVVGVLPGSGGAGASTLAVGLSVVAARQGIRTVLIDADPFGGGLDLALGLDRVPGLRWSEVPAGPGRWPPGLLGTGLPEIEGIRVLAGARDDPVPLRAGTVGSALDAASREGQLVVVDLPRHVGEVEEELLPRCARALLVAADEVRAAAAAAPVAAAARPITADLRVVVRTRISGGPGAEAVADAVDLPLAGRLTCDTRLAVAMDRGEAAALPARGPLSGLCRGLLRDVLRDPVDPR
jgi:secretion/DNA translocation related CpaE-like protein